jgi:hypothetical protein
VIELEIQRVVTEYQAEILENERGERMTAPFPQGVVQAVQYGDRVKAHAVYMSVHQAGTNSPAACSTAKARLNPMFPSSRFPVRLRPIRGPLPL